MLGKAVLRQFLKFLLMLLTVLMVARDDKCLLSIFSVMYVGLNS